VVSTRALIARERLSGKQIEHTVSRTWTRVCYKIDVLHVFDANWIFAEKMNTSETPQAGQV
jgi:hypothetical protein